MTTESPSNPCRLFTYPSKGLKSPFVGDSSYLRLALFVALVGIVTLILNPNPSYALSLVPQNLHLFILAFSMMLTLVVGSIDLSLGYTVAITSILFAKVAPQNLMLGWVVATTTGILIGAFNGITSLKSRNAYMVTLMSGYLFRGLVMGISEGSSILVTFSTFKEDQYLWGVFFAVLCVALIFPHTRFGLAVYATGDCREAAQLCVETDACYVLAHIGASVGASVAAVISCSRLGAASPLLGSGWEIDAVAACILGGCEFSGGTGSPLKVFTALVGLLLTKRMLYFLSFPPELYWVLLGGLVLLFLDKPFKTKIYCRRIY